MNILLIGSGGREHALAYSLFHSNSCQNIYSVPGNPGILEYSDKADIDIHVFKNVADYCKNNKISLVVVGPEQPLAEGITDYLTEKGIKVFGPSKEAAKLESSKAFAKKFMKLNNIPTADYQVFDKNEKVKALEYLKNTIKFPIVLKADGLAAGKGVVICKDSVDAEKEINEFYDGKFGDAGRTIVIEEFMDGEEASILAVTDGNDYVILASSQDHKRAYDGDKGPNTGGMGAYSPAPIVTSELQNLVEKEIIQPALRGMRENNSPFIGCLYAGLMIKDGKAKVVEFNVRFGDPETQAVLTNFKGDFASLLYSAAEGKIDKNYIDEVCDSHSCCIILSSKGYPEKYPKGQVIRGINQAEKTGVIVYHAGTAKKDDQIVVNGGRVLGVTGIGKNLKEAVSSAYSAIDKIQFDDSYYRKDIAHRAL